MLTKVTAYSQWANIDPLVLNIMNRPDTDLFEVRNIEGLGAVKANVNTTPLGSIRGEEFTGTSVGKRNIVMTLGLDPDWDNWTISRLRRLLDKTFMPEQSVRLVFETLEFSPVEISGWIESNEPNMFSKDPEQQISVICPEPNFVTVDPFIITQPTSGAEVLVPIDYKGSLETGFDLRVTKISGADVVQVAVDPDSSSPIPAFSVEDPVNHVVTSAKSFVMSSLKGKKFVQTRAVGTDAFMENLLAKIDAGSWPTLHPGLNNFYVLTDVPGDQTWELTYNEVFGSL